MAKIPGIRGIVYVSPTGAGTAVPVPGLNAVTFDSATDTFETTEFGATNKTYVQGLPDVKGTLGGFLDTADDTLFDAADSTDGCKLYIYPDRTYPSMYRAGPAWISVSMSIPSGGPVTISGSFVANGAWTRKP